MNEIEIAFHSLTAVLFFISFIFTLRFWILLRREKYWIGFPLAVFLLSIHELAEVLKLLNLTPVHFLGELLEVIGALMLIYASIGLRKVLIDANSYLQEKENLEF